MISMIMMMIMIILMYCWLWYFNSSLHLLCHVNFIYFILLFSHFSYYFNKRLLAYMPTNSSISMPLNLSRKPLGYWLIAVSQWVVLTDQSHALCRRQSKSLWVVEGFGLCNGAGCVPTGPCYTAIRQWGTRRRHRTDIVFTHPAGGQYTFV